MGLNFKSLDYIRMSIPPKLTPEQLANADHIRAIKVKDLIVNGSPKQKDWAFNIARDFLYYAHAWNFKAEEVDYIFATVGKSAEFWINNRPSRSGDWQLRVAIEKELEKAKVIRA